MKFNTFARFLLKLEETSSRTELTKQIADFFRQVQISEVAYCLYFMQGRLAPLYEPIEFHMSRKLVLRAITDYFGKDQNQQTLQVNELHSRLGDVGLVVEYIIDHHQHVRSLSLTSDLQNLTHSDQQLLVTQVYEKLYQISQLTGKGSQSSKVELVMQLLLQVDSLSAKYIARIITGELRLGVSEKTILDALSVFATGDKSVRKKLDKAFGYRADIGFLAQMILGNQSIEHINLTVGVPIASKLVEREKDSENVWRRMPECFVQPKLDGLRGQIHYDRKRDLFKVFSRNMEDMTLQFPELQNDIKSLDCDSVILDSEIIGYSEKNSAYLTYAETMQRKRKFDIEDFSQKIPIRAMCFDVLYYNGNDVSQHLIEDRLSLLKNLLGNSTYSLRMLETKKMQSEKELDDYFKEKVYNGLEGIITKASESVYEPGTRNFVWIKLKANTQSDLVDTIDVAIMGYYIGRGQRAQFGIGAFLAGVYDPDTDKYYSIGKVGSGMTESTLSQVQKDIAEIKLNEKPDNFVVDSVLTPDVWTQPTIIAEIIADEITRSPSHTAARGMQAKVKNDKPEKGLSIRFPRLKFWNRDKQLPNTVQEIIRMYELRKG